MPTGEASDTIEPKQAMRMLGEFMKDHSTHYGCHQPIIEPEQIILLCDGHSPSAYEVIPVDAQMMRKAMGLELSDRRVVTF